MQIVQSVNRLRARLHRASELTLQQLCYSTSDAAVIENNGVVPVWDWNPYLSDSIVFNENSYS